MEKYTYNYHPEQKYYTSFETCFESPLEPGVYLQPASSTLIPPPSTKDGELAVFDEDTNTWSICENMGGDWYDTTTGDKIPNFNLVKKPENATRKKPPIDYIPDLKYDKENDEWIIDVHYSPEDAPKSNIFPELLPSPHINYEPVYSEELKRWTFISTDSPHTYDQGLEQSIFRDQTTQQGILERLEVLGINLQQLAGLLGISPSPLSGADEPSENIDIIENDSNVGIMST